MNQLISLPGYELIDPPREWNIQPPAAHFKFSTSPPKNSPVVSAIMVIFNHHTIDNEDVEVHPSGFPVEYNSEYVPYPDTTPIKPIDDDKIDHILELFHSEHDNDLIDNDLQMIQA